MSRDGEGRGEQRLPIEFLVWLLVGFMLLFLAGVVLAVVRSQWQPSGLNADRVRTLARDQLEAEKLRQEILNLQRQRGLLGSLATNATILIGAFGFVVTGLRYVDERRRQRIEDARQREKDRRAERDRLAALYVNPFLFASEDLQSRLYNILCTGGLGVLVQQYRNGRHAVELLYLIARYFAYEELLIRYTPYGIDGHVLSSIQQIREAFSTSNFGHDEWRIFRPQQNALGRSVRAGRKGEYGDEPDSISLWDFERNFKELAEQDERLQKARDSLKDVTDIKQKNANTYKRLATVQSHLVCLLIDLEDQEGTARGAPFSLFKGARQRALKEIQCQGDDAKAVQPK